MRPPLLRHLGLALLGVLLHHTALATAIDTPAQITGATVVSAEQTKRLVESGALIVDVRVGNEFAEAHIRGAVNVPYKEVSRKAADFDAAMDRFELTKLPTDKSKSIIFYCNSGDCWRSYKASVVTVRAGYRQVYWFRGGFPEWKRKGFPVE